MVRDCNPDDIGISVSYPLPGTKFYDRVREQLGNKRNWVDSDDLEMMFQGAYVTEFYRVLHHVVHHEFRMRKAADRVRTALRQPATLRPRHVRDALAIPRHWVGLQRRRRQLGVLEKVKRPDRQLIPLQPVGSSNS
jgi:anaerobic magnesium-protoporphyrin IX monomethyl ester cyclase